MKSRMKSMQVGRLSREFIKYTKIWEPDFQFYIQINCALNWWDVC